MRTLSSKSIITNGQIDRMRVLIVGLPLFAKRLQKDLSEFDSSNKYYCLDTYYSKVDQLKALFLIPRVDVVYSINGTLGNSRVFELALKKKKKVMMTWVGTDVTKAKRLKEVNERFLNDVEHYCEVDWIKEELKELNIHAEVLNFFNFKEEKNSAIEAEKQLQILTYISKGREKYYGWDEIISTARLHADVLFTVVGTDGKGFDNIPDNVSCLGWVEDMDSLFKKAQCTIRFVEHDGLSGFVLESLFRGKQVLYSEPLQHCIHVKSVSEMSQSIGQLKEKHTAGENLLNQMGREYVQDNFNQEVILSGLIDKFKG